jgi:hypothetical protein
MTTSELRSLIRETIKEASQTGTGASFQAGDGEGYATPFAFSRRTLKPKKKGPLNESQEIFNSFKKDFDNAFMWAGAYLEDDKIKIYLDKNPNKEATRINKLVQTKYSDKLKKVKSEDDVMIFKITSDVLENIPLNEVSYREFRKNTEATPKQKIGNSMREVARKINEINKLIKHNKKLKEDMGMGSGKYWKSTKNTLSRLSEKIKTLNTEIINLGN